MHGRLLRLWHASYGYGGRVTGRDEENGAVDEGRYTPVVRRGVLSTGTGRWRSVQQLPGFQ